MTAAVATPEPPRRPSEPVTLAELRAQTRGLLALMDARLAELRATYGPPPART